VTSIRTRILTLRADEVRRGDVIAIRGVVGTVIDAYRQGWNTPFVYLTVSAGMAGIEHDVFAPDRPIVTERPI
jgi:hypothetical protein